MKIDLRKFYSVIFCLSLTGVIVFAQSDDDESEVYELSPFEVSVDGDIGYLSTNATSGTSLNTAIRDLPMPLEVINSELIGDLQATDLDEALEYSAGVYNQSFENRSGANEGRFSDSSPSSTNLNASFTNTISLRGYTVPNSQRFGFRVGAIVPAYNVVLGGSTDTITTERIEVVRGPQALLYGINVLSGVVNVIPKEPLFDPAYSINASAGSYGYRRSSIDATGPVIKDRLAYRFLGSYTDEDHWTLFRSTKREDYGLQFKWRITPKYDLFVEAKRSNFHQNGIGSKYFSDNDSAGRSQYVWTNEWDESITFGRDDITAPLYSDTGNVWDSPWIRRSDYNYEEKLWDYGNNYRISGPDTFYDREETTITALLRAKITDNLSGEIGAYRVEQEDETFNVNLRTFTDSRGPVRPAFAPEGFFGRPPQERNVTPAMTIWWNNPEINRGGSFTPLSAYGDANYEFNQGVGETFAFPWYQASAGGSGQFPIAAVPENAPESDDLKSPSVNRKFARYAWYKDRNKAESTQLRARLVYNFDYDVFGVPANHTFSVGANYIGDVVTFNTANIASNNDNYIYSSYQSEPEIHKQDTDPYYLRDSIFDMTPLRYNGETVAILANPGFGDLAGFRSGNTSGQQGSTIARSGNKEATLWYRGFYGLYQGKFWEDKLNVILGVREDQYQVKEAEQLMIVDQLRISDVWQGSIDPVTPWLIGYGTGEYKSPAGIPQELDAMVRADYATLQELQPTGTVEYNFPDYQKFQTGTFGLSYRITDPISVYYIYSEGVFPNTGQRDGAYNPIDAEQTINNEIGFKFDLLDGKISGTVSFYQIDRENAVYNWSWAPAPAKWHGSGTPLAPTVLTRPGTFAPEAAEGPGSPYVNGMHYPVAQAVGMEYVKMAFEELGIGDEFPAVGGSFPPGAFNKWGATEVLTRGGHEVKVATSNRVWLVVEEEQLANNPEAAVLRRAFELAMESADPYSLPIYYQGASDPFNHNPSGPRSTGANVTFGEQGRGVDGQIIFSPTASYQIVFSYSYQKREVTAFNLVDAADLNTGKNWGTEWDSWVYILGKENFADPTRASTFNGGSVRGLDLSFVPQYSAKLWNMYRFREGPLDGLRIGGGVQYIGSAPTSVPIGGSTLASNLYATPDTAERFIVDTSVSYKWNWGAVDWYLSLRISNLLDEREDTTYAEYTTILNTVEKRRTRIYYNPRTWRLSLTAKF
jgi:outer membrane receptor protein involved in Fe transport